MNSLLGDFVVKLRLRPDDIKKNTRVNYRFRADPPRVLIDYTRGDNTVGTKFITLCASEGLNEKDLTKFLADCLVSEEDIRD